VVGGGFLSINFVAGFCWLPGQATPHFHFADNYWICSTTNNLFRFHKNKLDEILCKLDSKEYARPFSTLSSKVIKIKKERKKETSVFVQLHSFPLQ